MQIYEYQCINAYIYISIFVNVAACCLDSFLFSIPTPGPFQQRYCQAALKFSKQLTKDQVPGLRARQETERYQGIAAVPWISIWGFLRSWGSPSHIGFQY